MKAQEYPLQPTQPLTSGSARNGEVLKQTSAVVETTKSS